MVNYKFYLDNVVQFRLLHLHKNYFYSCSCCTNRNNSYLVVWNSKQTSWGWAVPSSELLNYKWVWETWRVKKCGIENCGWLIGIIIVLGLSLERFQLHQISYITIIFLSKFYKDLIVSKWLEIFFKISSEVHWSSSEFRKNIIITSSKFSLNVIKVWTKFHQNSIKDL